MRLLEIKPIYFILLYPYINVPICHSYVDELLYWSGRRMRLDEFLRGDLTGERLPTTWVNSHQLVYQADDGGLLALDTFNNSLTVLVTNHTLVSYLLRYKHSDLLMFSSV